jgi:ParB-like chromosome segregation protein Spo0J
MKNKPQYEVVPISTIRPNPNNPRIIKDDQFKRLVDSIKGFPAMLEIRPIVVNDQMIILGGNMRLRACQEAGLKNIPIIKASDLTEEQQREFIIKDNVGFGEWDWNTLANEWDAESLTNWGLNVPQIPASVDYSILEDESGTIDEKVEQMEGNVMKGILIDFYPEDHEEAMQLIKEFKSKGIHIGSMLIEKLRDEKQSWSS